MIFYIEDDMQAEYQCGSGILLSTDRKTGDIRLQWVVIIRLDSNRPSKANDTMRLLREIQNEEQKINQEDRTFEQSAEIIMLDQIIQPFLEEQIPSSLSNQIRFSNLEERHERLFRKIQSVRCSEVEIAEIRVANAKAQYEKALAELNAIKQ